MAVSPKSTWVLNLALACCVGQATTQHRTLHALPNILYSGLHAITEQRRKNDYTIANLPNRAFAHSLPTILKQRRLITSVFLFVLAAHWALFHFFSVSRRPFTPPEIILPLQLVSDGPLTKFKAVKPKIPSHKIAAPPPESHGTGFSSIANDPGPSIADVVQADAVSVAPPAQVEPELPPMPVIKPVATVTMQLPPSANYLLDVTRTEPKVANPYYGSGEIQWSHDDKSYKLQLEVGVDFLFAKIRLYSLISEGTVGDTGVRPVTMTESRRNRSATATHFNYDAGTISFSAVTKTFPLEQGAQDRATILMQLASIGNADAQQFQEGRQLTIQVAEDTDAAPFQFIVLKQETIDTRLGHLSTWHIVRPPRPGQYSSRLDIWFAPELNWLPVQIRNTEANGAITTQTIRKIVTGT